MATVSIIIPVYNKGVSLEACLNSVRNQTFQDLECILVNDGSTDESGAICDQFAAKDSRIKVLHKQNGGVSSARNAGIEIAAGDYLMFCDADDTIPPDTLENLLRPYLSFDGQLVVGDFDNVLIDPQKNTVRSEKSYSRAYTEIDMTDPDALYDFFTKNNMLSSCGKLFHREMVVEHQLCFDTSLIVLEDYAFVIEYLSHCDRICMIPEVVYSYITSATSSVVQRRARKDFLFDVLAVSDRLERFLGQYTLDNRDKFHQKTIYPILRLSYDVLWSLEVSDAKSRKEKYARIAKAIKTQLFQKMLHECRDSFNRLEYRCLKMKSVWCLLLLHGVQRMVPRKRNG